jgi:hypothetical protein
MAEFLFVLALAAKWMKEGRLSKSFSLGTLMA